MQNKVAEMLDSSVEGFLSEHHFSSIKTCLLMANAKHVLISMNLTGMPAVKTA